MIQKVLSKSSINTKHEAFIGGVFIEHIGDADVGICNIFNMGSPSRFCTYRLTVRTPPFQGGNEGFDSP